MAASDTFLADYQTLKNDRGFVTLKNWSTVTITGDDRQSFLHNMCTNDIRGLQVGESCEAFCTDVQGKIVAHLFVVAREDRLELLAVPGQAETLIAHLDRYVIREDVVLADASREVTWLFVGGGCENASAAASIDVARSGVEGLVGSLLGVAIGQLQKVQSQLHGACCDEAWEAIRIEAGLPLFGVDFDNTSLPQEINRDTTAISFNKGCYLGQETIARIDALGHVNKKVVLAKFTGETAPPVGLELNVAGKTIGRVTSGCWSPRLKAPLALAMVRRGSNELESQLESVWGSATVIAPLDKET